MKICFSSAGRIRTIHVTVKISRVAANLWLHIKGDYTCNRELNLNAPEGVLLANAPPSFPPNRASRSSVPGWGLFQRGEARKQLVRRRKQRSRLRCLSVGVSPFKPACSTKGVRVSQRASAASWWPLVPPFLFLERLLRSPCLLSDRSFIRQTFAQNSL